MTVLKVPKLAVSMQEGVLANWIAGNGERVEEGQPIYTLEFEKSAMDVEAPASGVLRHAVSAGTACRVGEVIGEIEIGD